MTALKGANVTKVDTSGMGDNLIPQGEIESRLIVWTDSYTAAGASIADTIDIAVLPKNCKVQRVEVYHAALGSSTTLTAGDSDDADRYIAATSTSSAGKLESTLTTAKGYVVGTNDGDTRVFLTVGGAAITGLIKTSIYYTL